MEYSLKNLFKHAATGKKAVAFSSALFLLGMVIGGSTFLFTPLRYTPAVEPTIKNIENTDFYTLYEKNPDHYIFIDVRDTSTYTEGHPKGAINVPLAKLYTERHALPKTDKEIVLICGGNSASGVAYSYLQHYGFTNIKRIPGGYREWLIAGLPIEKTAETPQKQGL